MKNLKSFLLYFLCIVIWCYNFYTLAKINKVDTNSIIGNIYFNCTSAVEIDDILSKDFVIEDTALYNTCVHESGHAVAAQKYVDKQEMNQTDSIIVCQSDSVLGTTYTFPYDYYQGIFVTCAGHLAEHYDTSNIRLFTVYDSDRIEVSRYCDSLNIKTSDYNTDTLRNYIIENKVKINRLAKVLYYKNFLTEREINYILK